MILLYSCGKNEVYQPVKIQTMLFIKKLWMLLTKKIFCRKIFTAELNFKDMELAAKSAIMASFSFYAINFYDRAINSLDRYIRTYPADKK